ncbi:hypothetical protein BRE01_26990 [Brevibacillus reuszeri]|uniref:Uncharacterized protein n=1 Tax=Brevibacillus reuszeri TaxID=54915 RepID=A0A0K9YLY6_9BACL|nr:hypothetical protein [Brevibacillus reuszeri]KNB69676.1 hypothetical protein ADS79_27900 [Brevibacillus reuszeri]MED1855940.1 hypothetical protein [Brevibacillus reuszeri]GED68997.1 hypothetical protein BRE01_26990 [Brevibacillus reuszeri]
MNKIEINAALVQLNETAMGYAKTLQSEWKDDALLYIEYARKIQHTFHKMATFQTLQKHGETAIWEAAEERGVDADITSIVTGWIEAVRHRASYNPLNFFIALRLYERKRSEIRRKYNQIHYKLSQLQKQYGKLADEAGKRKGAFAERILEDISFRNQAMITLKETTELEEMSFREQIELWFTTNRMRKSDFLSLITLEKRLHYWDGVPNRTSQDIAELPDELDFEAFQDGVFINKIEHQQDSYLFDQFMREVMKFIDENPRAMFGTFQKWFGAMPTFTAHTDKFGRIAKLEPSKPNLTIVH